MLPASIGVAVLAMLLLLLHVARRYPAAPKLVPYGLHTDGRPRRSIPKLMLWLSPVAQTITLAIIGFFTLHDSSRDDHRTFLTLVFLILTETAALGAWAVDRQIELARKQTFRVAPSRLLLVTLPLLATIALALVIAIRDNRY